MFFEKALPVFAKGCERKLNYYLTLRAEAESLLGSMLCITACSFYRLSVNGSFVAFGPARAAKGYTRVDEIPLSAYDNGGVNEIVIEVAGYYCKSLSAVRQPSFVIAELRKEGKAILYTGRDFCAYRSVNRLQNTERFSGQRHFGEIWDFSVEPFLSENRVELAVQKNNVKYLPRVAPMADTELIFANGYGSMGRFYHDELLPCRNNRYSFEIDANEWGAFPEEDIPFKPFRWVQKQRLEKQEAGGIFPKVLSAGEYVIVDMGQIECGFPYFELRACEDSDVVLAFSESSKPDTFEFMDINMQPVIEYLFSANARRKVMSFEPYTCKVAIFMVKKGKVELSSVGVRRFVFDRKAIRGRKISGELAKIYDAAVTTFLHNTLDIYMDCPSRERAGWLCDSYFTGKVEYFFTGKSDVESAFLENYRLYKNDGELPLGMLPMCYPSNIPNNERQFIPQWCMWYILEVRDHILERGGRDAELFKKSILGILDFLKKYENKDGLLQDLPNWNFVEWSAANEWVKNVNYPTNFLYAEVLRAADELYELPELREKGDEVSRITCKLSFDGEVFIDNAVFDADGILKNTENSSEAGQYYALLFGKVDIELPKYKKLKKHILEGFSNFDTAGRGFVPVNAFIGFYLRILVLMKLGCRDRLAEDIKTFFGGMVESTGTLWEYADGRGSRDHGFASFAAVAIDFIENK